MRKTLIAFGKGITIILALVGLYAVVAAILLVTGVLTSPAY